MSAGAVLADLHLHTTASDGVLTPEALVARLSGMGFMYMAITDHDAVAALAAGRAAADERDVGFINGVELSAGAQAELHVLGYAFAPESPEIAAYLAGLRADRRARMRHMLDLLEGMGVAAGDFSLSEDHAPGRMHIARMLVQSGRCNSVSEAFARYLSPGKPLYVPRKHLPLERAISLIRGAGGVAVLAHPGLVPLRAEKLEALVCAAFEMGLMGLECYHHSHTGAQAAYFCAMARRMGLLVTGGSDFHGVDAQDTPGRGLALWQSARADVAALLAAVGRD